MSHHYSGHLKSLNASASAPSGESDLARRAREIVDGNRATVGRGPNSETMAAVERERYLQRAERGVGSCIQHLPTAFVSQRAARGDDASEDEREDQDDDAPRPNESVSQREMRLMNERIRAASQR